MYIHLAKCSIRVRNLQYLPSDLAAVKTFLSTWSSNLEETQHAYRLLFGALSLMGDSANALKVVTELLSTYTKENASKSRDDAHKCIVYCINDPNIFVFDSLLLLEPIKYLEGELIHNVGVFVVVVVVVVIFSFSSHQLIVRVVQNVIVVHHIRVGQAQSVHGVLRGAQGLHCSIRYVSFNLFFVFSQVLTMWNNEIKTNKQKTEMNHEKNVDKMRILTLMSMAETSKELPFELLQKQLNIDADDIESFVIDAIRTKCIRCKIDHLAHSVSIMSVSYRTFSKQHWQLLKDKLDKWRENLFLVNQNMTNLLAQPALSMQPQPIK